MCAEYRFVILFFLFNLLPRFNEVPRSWKNVLVINVFFPLHFTIIGLENNVRYAGVFVSQKFITLGSTEIS